MSSNWCRRHDDIQFQSDRKIKRRPIFRSIVYCRLLNIPKLEQNFMKCVDIIVYDRFSQINRRIAKLRMRGW